MIPSPIVSPQPQSSNNNNKSTREEATKKQTGVKKKEEVRREKYRIQSDNRIISANECQLSSRCETYEDSQEVRSFFPLPNNRFNLSEIIIWRMLFDSRIVRK